MLKLRTGPIAVTARELASLLFEVRGATAVTIVARTNPALKGGKNCPLVGLEKVSRVNGIIGFNYENSVNRERVRRESPSLPDGSIEHFQAGPRSWGKRLVALETGRKVPLVAKEASYFRATRWEVEKMPAENLYLEMKVQNSVEKRYELNGKSISEEEVTPHLRESSNPHHVILRDYRLDHLDEIVMNGNVYCLAEDVPHAA